MLKYLRIAVTALSLTACVLLIALWVRSYSWWDYADCGFVTRPDPPLSFGRLFMWESADGVVSFCSFVILSEDHFYWKFRSERRPSQIPRGIKINEPWRFEQDEELNVSVPHWFLVALIAVSGICPWIRWSKRFSLRTLLIATTLVAVGLAAIVIAAS